MRKTFFVLVMVGFLLAACSAANLPKASATPTLQATATDTPMPTPTITPSPTPEPRYEEIQGMMVPMNVYLEGEDCIIMELQGEQKCVNMFVAGQASGVQEGGPDSGSIVVGDFPENWLWRGIVYVVGDVRASKVVCENLVEVIRAENDLEDFFAVYGEEFSRSGINYDLENSGVHYEEPFYNSKENVSIEIRNFICHGLAESPIRFTAENPSPWENGFISILQNTEVSNVVFENYRNFDIAGGVISNAVFQITGGAGLWLEGNVILDEIQIYDTGHEGIGGSYFDSTIIRNSLISNNPNDACIVFNEFRGNPQVYGNTFETCPNIALLDEPKVPLGDFIDVLVENNSFFGVGFLIEYRGSSEFIDP